MVFTNYSLNILADFYGGAKRVALLLTSGTLVGVLLEFILSSFLSKIKSIKKWAVITGLISLICAFLQMVIPSSMLLAWSINYFIINVSVTMYAIYFMGIIAGQWFPTRKGTAMGIATISYPVGNGVIGLFANIALAPLASGGSPAVFRAFLPFLILGIIGFLLFLIFIKDYPEQCGAYRDNNKDLTPEVAEKMMLQEVENKRTTVWTSKHIFSLRDFWFVGLSCGLLYMGSLGVLTQSNAIITSFNDLNYTLVMLIVAICGAIGSWLLGVFDTAAGTKTAIFWACILMFFSGLLGFIAMRTGQSILIIVSFILIALYMGASSNYTVSVCAQYWRREDFSSVYGCMNPVTVIFTATCSTVVAFLVRSQLGVVTVFIFLGIIGILGAVMMIGFSKKHVKAVDEMYRKEVGKPVDDELSNRK